DLQPLRRHTLLLEQLPVQSAPLQLPALPGLGNSTVKDDAKPRCIGAQSWRDGEMHLLRAAYNPSAYRFGAFRTADQGWSVADRVPAVVSGQCHHLWQHQ